MPEKIELKPCPFCGGEASVVDNGCFIDVSCNDYLCRGWADSLRYKTADEAIEAWNRRYEPHQDLEFDYGAED